MVLAVKNPPPNEGDVRDPGSILESGRSPGREHGNPLQYSCLENPMDRGAWRATVHGVAKNWTPLKRLSAHTENIFLFLPFYFFFLSFFTLEIGILKSEVR